LIPFNGPISFLHSQCGQSRKHRGHRGPTEATEKRNWCRHRAGASGGLACEQEVPIPIRYEGLEIQCAYRADIIVDRSVLLELKAVETLLPIHQVQVLTYPRLSGLRLGLLLNFNAVTLKDGIRRLVRRSATLRSSSVSSVVLCVLCVSGCNDASDRKDARGPGRSPPSTCKA
jgi:GxxExxY protein